MYIRKTKRQYKKKTYNNYLLVESIHTSKGPRQKTICSLGDLSPRPAKDWLKIAHKIEDSLMGHSELFEEQDSEIKGIIEKVQQRQAARKDKEEDIGDIVSVYVDGVETEYHREAGSVHVGYQFWKKFEMHKILKQAGLSERAGVLTCAMTLNRLICPLSEHAMPNWMRSAAVDDIMGVDFKKLADDALYRNLDKLYPNRALIESALVERERSIFTLSPTIFFYDITSTYFEGEANGNEKAARGYSRDNRSDCK